MTTGNGLVSPRWKGPFEDCDDFVGSYLEPQVSNPATVTFTVVDRTQAPAEGSAVADGACVGIVNFMRFSPAHRVVELGGIWYAPSVHRTHVNTGAILLMLTHAFEAMGCRRVEWKCDNRNKASAAAAIRLGFEDEGVFKQVRGVG